MFFILIVRSTPINVIAKRKKKGQIKTIILIWLQATEHFNVKGTQILNHYEAGFQAKKPIKKWLNIILMGKTLWGFHTVYLPCY